MVSNLVPEPMGGADPQLFPGGWEVAKELQLSYLPLMQALFSQVNPIPIKAGNGGTGIG